MAKSYCSDALNRVARSRYGEAETANSRPAQAGASLVLSLDSGVQFAAEHELAAAMAEHRAKSGSVVVLDVVPTLDAELVLGIVQRAGRTLVPAAERAFDFVRQYFVSLDRRPIPSGNVAG